VSTALYIVTRDFAHQNAVLAGGKQIGKWCDSIGALAEKVGLPHIDQFIWHSPDELIKKRRS